MSILYVYTVCIVGIVCIICIILYCLVIEIMKFGMVWYGRKCEVEFKTLNQSIRYSAAVKVVK